MRCENCGQTVLTSDTVCWHCGWALSPPDPAQKNSQPVVKKQPALDISFSAITLFGLITVIIVGLLYLVIVLLGNKPVVVVNPQRNAGWVAVTDQRLRFTYDLPPDWVWAEKNSVTTSTLFDAATTQAFEYSAVLAALPTYTDDTEWHMVAVYPSLNQPAERFLLVASVSQRPISANDVLALAAPVKSGTQVLETAVTDNLLATPQAHWLLEVTTTNTIWKCQQEVVNNVTESYLIAACATQTEYPRFIGELGDILYSFQPLIH